MISLVTAQLILALTSAIKWIAATILSCVLVYQISSIIVTSTLFKPIRYWVSAISDWIGSLVGCVLCTSVWVGFAYSYFIYNSIGQSIIATEYIALNTFLSGILYSTAAYWIYLYERGVINRISKGE